jgi:methionyl-tRNA formyltransferase
MVKTLYLPPDLIITNAPLLMKNVLLVTDNEQLLSRFRKLVDEKNFTASGEYTFEYAFSFNNKALAQKFEHESWIGPVRIKDSVDELISKYDLVFSLHCKQIFPAKLVNNVKCINIHPGLNPDNRGWFPQVFSILNGLPCGATIHEIDEALDHGNIICQKEVKIELWDTSFTAYNKILDAEIELLSEHFESILKGTYTSAAPGREGNVNLKKDFDALCGIDLNDTDTFLNHINRLRALTHGNYANAYFTDKDGNKVFLKLELTKV